MDQQEAAIAVEETQIQQLMNRMAAAEAMIEHLRELLHDIHPDQDWNHPMWPHDHH